MIKHIAAIFGFALLLISIGTIGLYKLVGTYSGQDAICISGIIAGLIVGLWYGKAKGLASAFPIAFCSAALSVPLVVLSLVLAHSNQNLVESLAFFSIGFSLLFFYVIGCGWGKHLTRLST